MEDETTTNATDQSGGQSVNGVPIDDQGQAIPQPEESEQASAVEETPSEPEEQQTETPSEPSDDDQLAKWASNKGLELDSENATKAAKMAWNAERAMHQKAHQKSELEKTLTTASDDSVDEVAQYSGQDPEVLRRVQRIEIRDTVRDFYSSHPDARDLEPAMISELQKRPHLAGDLEALYAVVKTSNLNAVKSQGGREALERVAQKQQAQVPRGNAVNTAQMSSERITPQNVDQMVASHDQNWFKAHYDEINKAMAG